MSQYIRGPPISLFFGEVKFTPAIQRELLSKLRTVLTAHFAYERLAYSRLDAYSRLNAETNRSSRVLQLNLIAIEGDAL